MDLLPTSADLLDVNISKLPDRRIDGRNIRALMAGGRDVKSPHEALYFYSGDELQAVRSGEWKLHLPHDYLTVSGSPGRNGKPSNFENLRPESITQSGIRGIATRHGYDVKRIELSLFNVAKDPGETTNLADQHPEIVKQLSTLLEDMRRDLGDELTKTKGTGRRTVGNDDSGSKN
jgi:arylsulfatase A-like enzyme